MGERSEEEEFQEIQAKEKQLLFKAAKNGKLNIVKKLISRGVEIDCLDDDGNSPVDCAWIEKCYDVVLLLLKADSKFPKEFNLADLNDENESVENLKRFVEERNLLHEDIKNEKLEAVQNYTGKIKSKFYYSEINQTASSTAFKNRKFPIYLHLKSIGAAFPYEYEKREIERLLFCDKVALQNAKIVYFKPVSEGHLLSLISKSRYKEGRELRSDPESKEKFYDFYTKLDKIPEISKILKVIQYSDYFDIIYDFDEENVSSVSPICHKNTLGVTIYKEGRVYIGAKATREERKILGTIAHEVTHMVMQVLFDNECDPYYFETDGNGKNKFDQKTENIFSKANNIFRDCLAEQIHKDIAKIVLNIQRSYEEKDHHSELIAVVSQILAEYEQDGKDWLQKNATDLFNYYQEEVGQKCQDFIDKAFAIKVKNEVKKLNSTFGEIKILKGLNIIFNTSNIEIENFIRLDANIYILKAKFTVLGVMKLLQAQFGKNYVNLYEEYLVFSLENLVSESKKILQTFFLNACDILIIRVFNDACENELENLLVLISQIVEYNMKKKVFFVVKPNLEEVIRQKIEKACLRSVEKEDKSTSLNDLSQESKNIILSKRIKFQGKIMFLKDLIGENKNIHALITGDTIETLIEGKNISIGEKTSNYSNLEREFGYIEDEEINLKTFIGEFKKSDDIFVLKGIKDKDELLNHFKDLISEGSELEMIANQIQNFGSKTFETINKRILLANDQYFKEFCHYKWGKKIYFIEVENNPQGPKFKLQQLYNPNFYLERKFKIVINQDELEKVISEFQSEKFIITKTLDNLNLKKVYMNVFIQESQPAEELFRSFSDDEISVHWFHWEDNTKIYWKNSFAPGGNLRLDFKHLTTDQRFLIEEKYLVKHATGKKVMIIADNPGMGKSTTLVKLCESPKIAQNNWIIKIDFKSHVKSIEMIRANRLDMKNVIDFLGSVKPDINNTQTKKLLKAALDPNETFMKQVLFAFDGFDEILDDDLIKTMIIFLKFLKNHTRSKIWITTRLHYKNILETELSAFALQFDPIDNENKRKYIKKFFKDRLKLIFELEQTKDIFDSEENPKIQEYTNEFLEHMKIIFRKNVSTFVGTPLQLYLMAENSVKHFKHWIQTDGAPLDFSYLGNILEVFESIVDKKYEIYFKKQNIIEKCVQMDEKIRAEKYHKALAESLIRKTVLSENNENIYPLVLLIGLIQSQNRKQNEFIHFTFREYYAALNIIKYMCKESTGFKKRLKYFTELLESMDFKLIRKFINESLKVHDFASLPTQNIEHLKKYLTSLLGVSSPESKSEPELLKSLKQIFSNSIEERNGRILSFILFGCESDFVKERFIDLLTINREANVLLHCGIYNGDLQISETIFSIIENLHKENQIKIVLQNSIRFSLNKTVTSYTILEAAIESGSPDMLKLVLGKLDQILGSEDFALFLRHRLVTPSLKIYSREMLKIYPTLSHFITASHLDILEECSSSEIINILFNKFKGLYSTKDWKEILLKRNKNSPNLLYVAAKNNNIELIKVLLKEINEILSVEEQKRFILASNPKDQNKGEESVLHLAARAGCTKLVETLLNKAAQISCEKELIMMEDSSSRNAFQEVSKNGHVDILALLIERGITILPKKDQEKIIMKQDKEGNNILHIAAKSSNTEVMKIWLEKIKEILDEEDINKRLLFMMDNSFSENVFHIATRSGSHQLLKMLLENIPATLSNQERHRIVTKHDGKGDTVFHIAYKMDDRSLGNGRVMETWLAKTEELMELEEQEVFHKVENRFLSLLFTKYGCATMLNTLIDRIMPCEKLKEIIKEPVQSNNSVFYLAAKHGSEEVMKIWLKNAKKMLSEEEMVQKMRNVLIVATTYGSAESLSMINTILATLPEEKQTEIIMNLDEWNNSVFHIAAKHDNANTIKIWLKKAKEMILKEEAKNFLIMVENRFSETVFHMASAYGSVNLIKILLAALSKEQQKEVIMKQDGIGHSVLHFAVDRGNTEVVRLWLKKAEEIFSKEEEGQEMQNSFIMLKNIRFETVFHIAAKHRSIELMKMLLPKISKEKQKKLIMKQDKWGNTVLHIPAIQHVSRSRDLMQMLLEKAKEIWSSEDMKAKERRKFITMENGFCKTIFHLATKYGFIDLIKMLLENTSKDEQKEIIMKQDKRGKSVLHIAVRQGNTEIIQFWLGKAEEIWWKGEREKEMQYGFIMMEYRYSKTVFHIAAKHGLADVIEMLLSKLPREKQKEIIMKQDKWGHTFLHTAAMIDNAKKIKMNGEIFERSNTKKEFTDLIQICLQKIHEIWLSGEMDLKEKIQFITAENNTSMTIFQVAATHGSLDFIKLLLTFISETFSTEEQKNILMKNDKIGKTVFHFAASRCRMEVLNILLEKAEKILLSEEIQQEQKRQFIKMINRFSTTLFHITTKYGLIDVLKMLLRKIGEILTVEEQKEIFLKQDGEGNTVFHFAAMNRNSEVIQLWLKESEKMLPLEKLQTEFLMKKNNSCDTIFHIASKHDNIDVVKVLLAKQIVQSE